MRLGENQLSFNSYYQETTTGQETVAGEVLDTLAEHHLDWSADDGHGGWSFGITAIRLGPKVIELGLGGNRRERHDTSFEKPAGASDEYRPMGRIGLGFGPDPNYHWRHQFELSAMDGVNMVNALASDPSGEAAASLASDVKKLMDDIEKARKVLASARKFVRSGSGTGESLWTPVEASIADMTQGVEVAERITAATTADRIYYDGTFGQESMKMKEEVDRLAAELDSVLSEIATIIRYG